MRRPQVEDSAIIQQEEPIGLTFQPEIYEVACSWLPRELDARLLDLGAGEGYLTKLLRDRGYTDVSACDHDATRFKPNGVPFAEADLNRRLPYEDDSFDCVFSLEVAEHVEHHDNYFRELVRITRPGGRVVLSTPNVQNLSSRFYFMLCGLTSAATRVFDPRLECWEQHVNHLSLQQMLFYVDHHGAHVERLATNRYRKGAWFLMPLYPVLWLAAIAVSRRRRQRERGALTWRYHRLAMSLPMLLGRITFLVLRIPERHRVDRRT